MNYMRESELGYMNNPEKYYLAAAYQLAGYEEVGAEILAGPAWRWPITWNSAAPLVPHYGIKPSSWIS